MSFRAKARDILFPYRMWQKFTVMARDRSLPCLVPFEVSKCYGISKINHKIIEGNFPLLKPQFTKESKLLCIVYLFICLSVYLCILSLVHLFIYLKSVFVCVCMCAHFHGCISSSICLSLSLLSFATFLLLLCSHSAKSGSDLAIPVKIFKRQGS